MSIKKYMIRIFLTCAASLAFLLTVSHAKDTPPNIVIIIADDLGYGDVGCYGAKKIPTPNIDRLASEGMLFRSAHAPAAVCQPTRYAILSGRYYWRSTPNPGYSYYFDEGEILLPQILRDAGYETAGFGKWHLGFGSPRPADFNGSLTPGTLDAGFNYYFGLPRSHNEPPFVYFENDRVYQADPADPIRIISQKERPHPYGWGSSEGGAAAHAARQENELDLVIAERAAGFISKQSVNEPFFMYIPFVAPHFPITPNPDFLGESQAGDYGDFIVGLDHSVGVVLNALKTSGHADNTLVIFSSDNGAVNTGEPLAAGHRPNGVLLGQKTDGWEGGHRVPFIARWPGKIKAGATSDALLGLQDLLATSVAAAGVDLPLGAGPDSINQLPVLLGESEETRNSMVYQGVLGFALRDHSWVYLPSQDSQGFSVTRKFGVSFKKMGYSNNFLDDDGLPVRGAPDAQLYDIKNDISQKRNVILEHPEVAEKMASQLDALLGSKPLEIVRRKKK
ncbi:sulfatase family protein [Coraliomargarita sp. W4R53]